MPAEAISGKNASRAIGRLQKRLETTYGKEEARQAIAKGISTGALLNPFRPNVGKEEIDTWGERYLQTYAVRTILTSKLFEARSLVSAFEGLAREVEKLENLALDKELNGGESWPAKLTAGEKAWLRKEVEKKRKEYMENAERLDEIKQKLFSEFKEASRAGIISEKSARAMISSVDPAVDFDSVPPMSTRLHDSQSEIISTEKLNAVRVEIEKESSITAGLVAKFEEIKKFGNEIYTEEEAEEVLAEQEIVQFLEKRGRTIRPMSIDDFLQTREDIRRQMARSYEQGYAQAMERHAGEFGPRSGRSKSESLNLALALTGYSVQEAMREKGIDEKESQDPSTPSPGPSSPGM